MQKKKIIHNEFERLRNILTYETRKSKKDFFKNDFEKKTKTICPLFGKEFSSLQR